MEIVYSHFKRYSRFSIGGVSSHIERKNAKALITRFKGKIRTEKYRLPGDSRFIDLSNGNQILVHLI